MIELSVNGKRVEVADGATLLDAIRAAGAHVPTLCYCGGCDGEPSTSCFVCVVAIEGRDSLVPACAYPAQPGLAVLTDTPAVRDARLRAVELLLSDHLGECLAPCQLACPAGWAIPEFAEAIAHDDLAKAAALAGDALVLPETLGHICPAPCEKACRRADRDQPIAIADLHRWLAEHAPAPLTVSPKDTGRSVGIIGAGPAGLAAAARLRRAGHAATIFDATDAVGGTLRTIDADTLPPAVLECEIDRVRAAGVRFELGQAVAPAELAERFDAVILASGESDQPVEFDRRTRQLEQAPGVFVAGALAGRGRLAVSAVADGLAVGDLVTRHLAGAPHATLRRDAVVRLGPLEDHERDALLARGADGGRVEPIDDATARAEASRCLLCGCRDNHLCRLRRLATELDAKPAGHVGQRRRLSRDDSHRLIEFESHKCILCGLCVREAAAGRDRPGLTFLGRGFAARVGGPYDRPLGEGLGDEALRCAQVCPTSALVKRRYPKDEPETLT